jgi:hypothetical protein
MESSKEERMLALWRQGNVKLFNLVEAKALKPAGAFLLQILCKF